MPLTIQTLPHFLINKHIGAKEHLAPTDQPTLSQILAEIEGWLGK